jgi:hypothetical protein
MNTAVIAMILEASLEAFKVLGDAAPILAKFQAMSAAGASFEDIASGIRNLAVASETDAQVAVDKMPS